MPRLSSKCTVWRTLWSRPSARDLTPSQHLTRGTRASERGAALILFSLLLLFVLLPLMGLAFDTGMAYFIRSRLIAAADAAALAGGRSLNVGMDPAAQFANAKAIATQYFNANFPSGYLGVNNLSVNATAGNGPNNTRVVNVQVSATLSLYFSGLFGASTTTLNASAQTSRRDVNVMLLLDRSGSMGRVCEIMKASAESFVDKFTNGRDRVGLITFMGNAHVDYPSALNFKPGLNLVLDQLNCGGDTGSAAALSLARQQLTIPNNLNILLEPGALNVVVFFTDGVPNGYTAAFPVNTPNCNAGQPVTGFVADGPSGIFDSSVPQNANPPWIATTDQNLFRLPGCNFNYWSTGAAAYIPDYDIYGNSASTTSYASVTRVLSALDSQLHIPITEANINAASMNAADYAALALRKLGVYVYTIGLDGDGGVDSNLLRRVANDTASQIYDSSQPTGLYVYTPNATQLSSAFNTIASEVLRISQ
jgi:Flp pilus assembly protein TadG